MNKKVHKFEAFIILNYLGNLWSLDNYWDEKDARQKLDLFWGEGKYDKKKFKIVKAKITVDWSNQ